jgi:cell division septum initiation protein DivIVA
MNILNLTSTQLRQAADLQEKIAELQHELAGLTGIEAPAQVQKAKRGRPAKLGRPAKVGKRTMSAAHKAKIRAAQKLRWKKYHAAKAASSKPVKKKRKMSAAGRAAIIAAVKARWAKVKAAKRG